MLTGNWRNFEELEESLSLPELEAMVSAKRRYDNTQNRFLASIQGIDIPDPVEDEATRKFKEIEARVKAKRLGIPEDEVGLYDLGIVVEKE